jgi:hypothetical protein
MQKCFIKIEDEAFTALVSGIHDWQEWSRVAILVY